MTWSELDTDDRLVLYRRGWNPDEETLLKSLRTTGWSTAVSDYFKAIGEVDWEFVVLAEDEDGRLAVVASAEESDGFLATLAVFDPSSFD